jgi:archaemetzincin
MIQRHTLRLAWLNIPLGLGAVILLVLCTRNFMAQADPPARPPVTPELMQTVDSWPDVPKQELIDRLIPLHTVKKPPGPMDWMTKHPEPGQDFYQYALARPVRPDQDRTTIYVSVLGPIDETRQKIIGQAIAYMAAFYNVPVKLHTPINLDAIPKEARRVHPVWGDKQILAPYVTDKVLRPVVPKDALCYIAFTGSDLWPGEG